MNKVETFGITVGTTLITMILLALPFIGFRGDLSPEVAYLAGALVGIMLILLWIATLYVGKTSSHLTIFWVKLLSSKGT